MGKPLLNCEIVLSRFSCQKFILFDYMSYLLATMSPKWTLMTSVSIRRRFGLIGVEPQSVDQLRSLTFQLIKSSKHAFKMIPINSYII